MLKTGHDSYLLYIYWLYYIYSTGLCAWNIKKLLCYFIKFKKYIYHTCCIDSTRMECTPPYGIAAHSSVYKLYIHSIFLGFCMGFFEYIASALCPIERFSMVAKSHQKNPTDAPTLLLYDVLLEIFFQRFT